MKAIEMTGTIEVGGHLLLENPVPIAGSHRVRVLILIDEPPIEDLDEPDESAWLAAASRSPAVDFLRGAHEDVYSSDDGEPFDAQG